MKNYIESIEININGEIKDFELAEALRLLADDIECGKISGLIGWSDISYSVGLSENEYNEESEVI